MQHPPPSFIYMTLVNVSAKLTSEHNNTPVQPYECNATCVTNFAASERNAAPLSHVPLLPPSISPSLARSLQVQWHYPAGRIDYTTEWFVGEGDEELVADVMTRHSCGQHRLSRILKDLSGH